MQRDFKIGMVLGLVVVAAAVLWLAIQPNLSTKARTLNSHNTGSGDDTFVERPRFVTDLPNVSPREAAAEAEQSSLPDVTASEQTEEVETLRFHIVRRGETLSDIAYKYYGSASKWKKILEANGLEPRDAKRLRPGTKLIIPE